MTAIIITIITKQKKVMTIIIVNNTGNNKNNKYTHLEMLMETRRWQFLPIAVIDLFVNLKHPDKLINCSLVQFCTSFTTDISEISLQFSRLMNRSCLHPIRERTPLSATGHSDKSRHRRKRRPPMYCRGSIFKWGQFFKYNSNKLLCTSLTRWHVAMLSTSLQLFSTSTCRFTAATNSMSRWRLVALLSDRSNSSSRSEKVIDMHRIIFNGNEAHPRSRNDWHCGKRMKKSHSSSSVNSLRTSEASRGPK